MAKNQQVLNLSVDSNYSDVITFDNGRLKSLTKDVVDSSRKNFKTYDLDSDGFLDFHDVTKMMEKLGQTKTATEVRKIIAEVDNDKDGMISYAEFLAMLAGPQANSAATTQEPTAFGRIYEKGLGEHAKFFEQAAAGQKDKTAENRDQIKAEYAEKKKLQEAKKIEMEKEKAEAEAKAAQQAESRNKLAARAAMFGK